MNKNNNINYALLAIPLAFVGLPIYINVTDFYIRNFDINIANLALVILIVRFIDSFQEPLLGLFSDYLIKKNIKRQKIIYFSSFFLALSFFALFNPYKNLSDYQIIAWLFLTMLFTYTFYNLIIVNFESLAVVIAKNSAQRIAINSTKESLGLIGVIFSSALPSLINLAFPDSNNGQFYLTIIFVLLLLVILVFFFSKIEVSQQKIKHKFVVSKIIKDIMSDHLFLKFLLIFFINALAVSMPASAFTFYVKDIIKKTDQLGIFLVIYFVSAGLFVPLWKKLALKYGKINSWLWSIVGSIVTFIFAFFIGENNAELFYLVCFFSGIFLGADLVVPPSIIAEIIHNYHHKISSYVSLWSMVNKAALMLASFLTLYALSLTGFEAENVNDNSLKLIPILYAIIPCILKLIVVLLLLKKSNFLPKASIQL